MRAKRPLLRGMAAVALVANLLPLSAAPVAAVPVCNSTVVSNKANFESDTIYELLTDRFADGDASNNNPLDLADSYDPTPTTPTGSRRSACLPAGRCSSSSSSATGRAS